MSERCKKKFSSWNVRFFSILSMWYLSYFSMSIWKNNIFETEIFTGKVKLWSFFTCEKIPQIKISVLNICSDFNMDLREILFCSNFSTSGRKYMRLLWIDVQKGEVVSIKDILSGEKYCQFFFRFPSTRLGRVARAKNRKEAMEHCSIFYDKKVPEYFFDRNPENFSAILGKFCKN